MINTLKKITILFFILNFTIACSKNQNSETPAQGSAPKAEVVFSEVSANNCLNLEKIMSQLNSPLFLFPAAIMSTNLKPISEMSLNKSQYLSYTNFYYKTGIPTDLNMMKVASQNECDTIQLLTSSHEILNFKITEHSADYIKFELTDTFSDSISVTKQKALFDRIQPYAYLITYLSANSLKIVEKFSTIDPLCLSKDPIRLEVTKIVSWANKASELPENYDVDSNYLNTVKSTLLNPPLMVVDPVISSDSSVSVVDIKTIMATAIRDELKLCN